MKTFSTIIFALVICFAQSQTKTESQGKLAFGLYINSSVQTNDFSNLNNYFKSNSISEISDFQ